MNPNSRPKQTLNQEELLQFARSERLYAVLDACDCPELLEKIPTLPEDQVSCLYSNQAEEDFSAFAPYLFEVDTVLLDWVYHIAAQKGGGVFVVSSANHDTLRKHLRRFLLVLAPNGEEMYFRYYDPRVLPQFLAVCTEPERRDLFGPVLAFGVITEGEILLLPEWPGPLPETTPPRIVRTGLFQTRPDHLRAFTDEGERAFEYRLAEHLRENHGNLVKAFPDNILIELVRRGIARGRCYKLLAEKDLTAFVAIMFEIAPNFDSHPHIHHVLTDRRLSSVAKMDVLFKRVPDAIWEEAKRSCDLMAWLEPGKEII